MAATWTATIVPPDEGHPLINIKGGVRDYVRKCVMSENLTSTNEVVCPVCGRPMISLHTIRRDFAENLNVFKCQPCGFSTTEPVNCNTPQIARQAGGQS
jgi:predicted RNA-binding Zn-ribbon protein involved in translation (DUF1610 family)